jgi:hypothetical protein
LRGLRSRARSGRGAVAAQLGVCGAGGGRTNGGGAMRRRRLLALSPAAILALRKMGRASGSEDAFRAVHQVNVAEHKGGCITSRGRERLECITPDGGVATK